MLFFIIANKNPSQYQFQVQIAIPDDMLEEDNDGNCPFNDFAAELYKKRGVFEEALSNSNIVQLTDSHVGLGLPANDPERDPNKEFFSLGAGVNIRENFNSKDPALSKVISDFVSAFNAASTEFEIIDIQTNEPPKIIGTTQRDTIYLKEGIVLPENEPVRIFSSTGLAFRKK